MADKSSGLGLAFLEVKKERRSYGKFQECENEKAAF
jgi:hypothetical protein